MRRILVTNSDGVLWDATQECLLVVFLGYQRKGIDAFDEDALTHLPPLYRERFLHLRRFARHLSHYFLALLEDLPAIRTQATFDAAYNALDPRVVTAFGERVSAYRQQMRRVRRETWLGLHRFYPDVVSLLAERHDPTYLVTARDPESTDELLQSQGIALPGEQIVSEKTSLPGILHALSHIAEREQVPSDALLYVDWHLVTLREVSAAGYRAFWAEWGSPGNARAQNKTNLGRVRRLRDLSTLREEHASEGEQP